MVVNGFYMNQDGVFLQDAAMLITAPGGMDEPLPRVTSDELGHGFSRVHREARTKLMASGTTGTLLNDEEIHDARHKAESYSWTYTPEAFLKSAEDLEKGNKQEQARSRYQTLALIPGE